MPYETKADLPSNVTDVLPEHAQEIYRSVFNNAWDQYADPERRRGNQSREEVAHKVAWSAVEQKYKKNDHGKWVEK